MKVQDLYVYDILYKCSKIDKEKYPPWLKLYCNDFVKITIYWILKKVA